jgi:hypothetical protein
MRRLEGILAVIVLLSTSQVVLIFLYGGGVKFTAPYPYDLAQRIPAPRRPTTSVSWRQLANMTVRPKNETRRVFFVHVGKTGGETVRSALRVHCENFPSGSWRCWRDLSEAFYGDHVEKKGEPLLSRLVTGYIHYMAVKPPGEKRKATHYIFSIRHPLHRFESWYRYVSPFNCFSVPDTDVAASCRVKRKVVKEPYSFDARFWRCFSNISNVPVTLRRIRANELRESEQACADILLGVLRGEVNNDMAGHMVANYQYYHHSTLGTIYGQNEDRVWGRMREEKRGTGGISGIPVLVVRTPSIWEDMKSIDMYLGGGGYFSQAGLRVSHQSESFAHRSKIPVNETLLVCCVLHDEIAVYKELVERADNLDPVEKSTTLKEALRICQVSSWAEFIQACRLETSLLKRPPF